MDCDCRPVDMAHLYVAVILSMVGWIGAQTGCASIKQTGNVPGNDASSDGTGIALDAPAFELARPPVSDAPRPPANVDSGSCTTASCTPVGGRYCGVIGDGCGLTKDCGDCPGAGQVCNGHVCVEGASCVRLTCDGPDGPGGVQFCGRVGTGCGEALDCGACPSGASCSAEGVCVAANCLAQGCDIPGGGGRYCGKIGDGCGRTIDCGCSGSLTCGGTGIANVCGDPACVPIACTPPGGGQYCGRIGNGCGKAIDCPTTCPASVGGTTGTCPADHICPGTGGGTCSGLQCQLLKDACAPASQTTLTGTVYDPAGKNPLYNVLVYVPNAALTDIASGATCERCDAAISGQPVAAALTDAQGRFVMKNVPSGANIPVVIQIGKWRRKITVAAVPACTTTAITDKNLTRLPRNKGEGNIPKIAIATGHSDALECLLRKLGVDEAEFTSDGGPGRVHLFQGYQAAPTIMTNGASMPLRGADQLWSSSASMLRYDVVLMACEGSDNPAAGRTAAEYKAVRDYADLGGRIFGSHYHNNWIRSEAGKPNAGYPQVVKFASGGHQLPSPTTMTIDTSFPKGVAFRDWLLAVGASTTPGQLVINDGEHTVDAIVPNVAQQWITGTDTGRTPPTVVEYFSFTTPVAQKECGRMVFSDVHVSQGGGLLGTTPFPARCATSATDLSPQEKALEFMLFDLSSCVQIETSTPTPPPIPPAGTTPSPPGPTPIPPTPPPTPPPPPPPPIP